MILWRNWKASRSVFWEKVQERNFIVNQGYYGRFCVKKLDIVEIFVLISMLVCVVHSSTESCIKRAVAIGSARFSISVAIGVSEIHSGTVQEQVPEQISGMQLAPEKCPGTLRHFSGMELAQKIVQEVLRNLFLNSSGTVPGWISETPIATEMLKRADPMMS